MLSNEIDKQKRKKKNEKKNEKKKKKRKKEERRNRQGENEIYMHGGPGNLVQTAVIKIRTE